MSSLVNIAQGWYNYATASGYNKSLMESRLAICDKCPSKKQLNQLGEVIIRAFNVEGSLFKCGECNCPLAAKTAALNEKCPLGKWDIAGTESLY